MYSSYFQAWNDGKPSINNGQNGLQLLDEVVRQAEDYGIKLIFTFVKYVTQRLAGALNSLSDDCLSNWSDYGGMDVYVNNTIGYGQPHDLFYTDPQIAIYYKNYVKSIVDRYRNSEAIFAWELANEVCSSSFLHRHHPD